MALIWWKNFPIFHAIVNNWLPQKENDSLTNPDSSKQRLSLTRPRQNLSVEELGAVSVNDESIRPWAVFDNYIYICKPEVYFISVQCTDSRNW